MKGVFLGKGIRALATFRDLPGTGGWIWSKPNLIDDDTKARVTWNSFSSS